MIFIEMIWSVETMESKKIKTQVFTNEVLFQESAEQPVDTGFTLPDYCPEISKILKCRAVSRISSKSVNGRNIALEGTVTVTLLYADAEHKLCSFEHPFTFNKNFEMGVDGSRGLLCCKTRCEYLNCRAVTGRKIDLHGAVGITVTLKRRRGCEILSDYDDEGVELLRGAAPATTPMGCGEKYLMIEEEIELGQGQPSVRSLLRYDGAVTVRESKLLNGKAVVKGELFLTALYCPEEGSAQSVKTAIPFSQILEIEGVDEHCSCDTKAEIVCLELRPRQSVSGEVRSLSLSAKLLVVSEAYCDNDVAVVLDAFSRRCETEIATKQVCLEKLCYNLSERFYCKKNFEFEKGALGGVLDLWCEPQVTFVGMDGNEFVVRGVAQVGLLVGDAEGVPSYYEKSLEYEYRCVLDRAVEGMSCEPDVQVWSVNYTLTGENCMEIRVELGVTAGVYECKEQTLIADLSVDETRPLRRQDQGAMTVYFASAGETLWEIARQYSAGVEEMMQLNRCTEEALTEDRMILIPIS